MYIDVQHKLTKHCKSTIFNFFKLKFLKRENDKSKDFWMFLLDL